IGTFIGELVKTELSGNLVDVCPVGALTSKPYAFKARSWELRKTETIDVHDAVGSNIRVDARGREVMRVLPRLHEGVNETWISDRTRFAYDGLQKGRLDRPYIRDEDSGKLVAASWGEAFAYIAKKLQGMKGENIAGLVGDMAEVESIVALKDLLEKLGSPHMDCRTDGARFDVSNRAGYLFNSTIAGLDEADAILIIGANPRFEATMVNARIRKAAFERRVPVGVVGEAVDLSYNYHHVGTDLASLQAMVKEYKGKMQAKKPVWIIGSGVFESEDDEALHFELRKLAEDLVVITEDWNGFNVLHRAASRVGALDAGFVPQAGGKDFAGILEGTRDGSIKALYLLGADEFDARASVGWKTFVIYQGHHGDHGAARADVVLPGSAYTEKNGIYLNMEGRVQYGRKAVSAPGEAKEDWKILRALSEKLGCTLPYDTAAQLRGRIFAEFPAFAQQDQIASAAWGDFGTKGKVANRDFVNPVANYYMTNPICRASETMVKCSAAFRADEDDILEAAE
ncbi:MAG: molybdopterin-dependent oxidoreductase, partial [Alphaproteobacteria bacterium]|nr:molybdopterin-dependent oxidoreductase [Alphaproteobacteria bacterium]